MSSTTEPPSVITDEFWVYCRRADWTLGVSDIVGKWQLFVPRGRVDHAWAYVVELVQTGQLGPVAKVSTARPNPNSIGDWDLHVIVVYAPDWRDVADVRRILRALREAGLARGWVHFKRDRETLAGAYGNRGARGVSVWNSRDGDEITTTWVTGKRVLVTDENCVEIVDAIESLDACTD
jgi:hypothetical protein